MDNKLYNNKIIDALTIVCDLFIVTGIVVLFMNLVNSFDKYICLVYVAVILLMFDIYDVYRKTLRKKSQILLTVFISVCIASFSCFMLGTLFPHMFFRYGILFYIGVTVSNILVLVSSKLVFSIFIKKLEGSPKLLVLESDRVANDFARKIKYSYSVLYEAWYDVFDDSDPNDIDRIINERISQFDSVFISPNIDNEVRYSIVSKALEMGKEIYVLPDMYNMSTLKSHMVQFDDTPALKIRQLSLTRGQRFIKRLSDILISSVLIVLTSPIMLLCAIAVKCNSDGPVFYKQERLTIYKRKFNILKFRTMVDNAEVKTGAVLATEDDPRITKVGRFLRLTRLDELPQLFNIFFGSMAVVGPRPERKVFVDKYLTEIDNYDKRFFVKAGLTGLAQVYGKYQTQIKDKTLYDIMYIREYSFALDIKLILLTIKVMFTKESSNGISSPKEYETQVHESMKNSN